MSTRNSAPIQDPNITSTSNISNNNIQEQNTQEQNTQEQNAVDVSMLPIQNSQVSSTSYFLRPEFEDYMRQLVDG